MPAPLSAKPLYGNFTLSRFNILFSKIESTFQTAAISAVLFLFLFLQYMKRSCMTDVECTRLPVPREDRGKDDSEKKRWKVIKELKECTQVCCEIK